MTRPPVKIRPKLVHDDAALISRLAGALPSISKSSTRVSAWLAGLKANAAAKALRKHIDDSPMLARVLGGIAEAAPYLWDLVQADPSRFVRLLDSDPDVALAAMLAATRSAVAASRSNDEVMRLLRRMKAEAALSIALCDIGGVWPVERVTAALTDVAETALGAAVHYLLARSRRRPRN